LKELKRRIRKRSSGPFSRRGSPTPSISIKLAYARIKS